VKRILILGSGFAGVWAAIGAARRLDELTDAGDIEILLVSRNSFHDIRVRNYELDLTPSRIPLSKILDPVGVKHQIGEIRGINVDTHTVEMAAASGSHAISYDRLVIALGSVLYRPDIPGLREFSFDIDTFDNATRLNAHLIDVARAPVRPESATVVVIGAGLTGIEAATEMPAKLDAAWAGVANAPPQRVIVLDHSPRVGSNMGDSAVPVIKKALDSQGIESVTGAQVAMISQNGITLSTGAFIPAATVVWCYACQSSQCSAGG
jgi:NADH dehydrogenase